MIKELQAAVTEFMLASEQTRDCVDAGSIPRLPVLNMRSALIDEEFSEYSEAVLKAHCLHSPNSEDYAEALADVADALCDLLYVVVGTAVTWGFDLDPLLREVHRVNMTKFPGGKVYRRDDGKVTKPPGFVPCDLKSLIKKQCSVEA